MSEGKTFREATWPRFLIEGVVIVSSILLAFAVDAAWGRWQDAADEQLALDDLRTELRENVEAIHRRWLPSHIATTVATAKLLRLLHGIESELPEPTVADVPGLRNWYIDHVITPVTEHPDIQEELTIPTSLASAVTANQTYAPSIASLDILVQAGSLASLSEHGLRSRLAGLPAEIADLTDEELFVRDFYYREVYPRLGAAGTSMTVIDMVGDGSIGGIPIPDPIMSRGVTISGSRELSRVLAKRLDLQVNVVLGVHRIGERFEEILSLVP